MNGYDGKQLWYTLAASPVATYKMKFKERMTREEAVTAGYEHCREKGIEYLGTYDAKDKIDHAELKYRAENEGWQ